MTKIMRLVTALEHYRCLVGISPDTKASEVKVWRGVERNKDKVAKGTKPEGTISIRITTTRL